MQQYDNQEVGFLTESKEPELTDSNNSPNRGVKAPDA
jgi:hypothetical protein